MQSIKGAFDALASSTITVAKNITGGAIKDGAAAALRGASNYTSHHPVTVGVLVAGVGVAAAPGLVVAPILGAAGFTANGVAAGSAAAVVQSGIGNVVGGSVFATLQSAGAGGYGVAAVNTAVQAVGAAIGSTGAGAAVLGRSR